jgi:NAD-dependent SIR2 family protein deacetylase
MRISIPSIPTNGPSREHAAHTLETATKLLCDVLQGHRGRTLIMTGAGASVDSGIAPYRGPDGHYTVNKSYRPIFFHEFVEESDKGHAARQRYWSRSFLGYPPVLRARPNKTHYAVAAIQRLGYAPNIITQNVDSLHHHATPSGSLAAKTILELHGTLESVVCAVSPAEYNDRMATHDTGLYERLTMSHHHVDSPRSAPKPMFYNTPVGRSAYPRGCGFRGNRAMYQAELAQRNPAWDQLAHDMAARKREPKTNPDGDVDLGNEVNYASFTYAPCPQCGGVVKPAVIFFGESVPTALRDRSFELVDKNDAFIFVGTSLATYSAYRLVKAAQEQGKRTIIVNLGPTRADGIVDDKIEIGSSTILPAVAQRLAGKPAERDAILRRLLQSGQTILPDRMRGVVSS